MKRIGILFVALMFSISAYSQIFSTAQTLKSGAMSFGLNPAFIGNNFGLYFHGGYGLSKGNDVGVKLGFGHGTTYIEGNVEWGLIRSSPYLSLTTGAHYSGNFGLDLAMLVTFPVSRVFLTTGLDMDANFTKDYQDKLDMYFPVWLPFAMEFYVKKHMSVIFEAEVGIGNAATLVGGGVNLYF